MFRRILAMKLKIILVLAVVGGVVVIARKLMGGLGPEPGSELAPKEWPSLVPDPPAASTSTSAAPSTNGASGTKVDEAAE